MSTPERARLSVPLQLIVIDLLGVVLAGLGMFGLVADAPPAFAPALGDPAKAGLLVALGVVMMGYAIVEILRRARRAARGRD